jgi:hypothetical protein
MMRKLTKAEEEERSKLQARVLSSPDTLEEAEAILRDLERWLKDHPDDDQLLGEGEGLIMLREALKLIKRPGS